MNDAMSSTVKVLHFEVIAPLTLTISQARQYTNLGAKKIKSLITTGAWEIARPDHTDKSGRFIKGKTPLIFRESIETWMEKRKVEIPKL